MSQNGDKQQEIIEKFLSDQEAFDEQFRQHNAELLEQTRKMRQEMLSGIKGKRVIPPEVQDIVNLLIENPVLVGVTKDFIEKKLVAIQKAVEGVLDT